MKKLYTAFLLLFAGSASLSAQPYQPMLDSVNEWTYTVQTLGVSPSSFSAAPCSYPYVSWNVFRHYTTGDTIIDSLSYKIVMNSDQPCEVGYLREDTAAQQVFFRDNLGSQEILLYDFSMQVGDSIYISFVAGGLYQSGMHTLDSITTYYIGAGPRRAFHFSNPQAWNGPLTWVESVGQLNDVIYTHFNNMTSFGYFSNCPGIQHQGEQFMICFSHASRIFLDSCSQSIAASMPIQTFYVDSCNYSSFLGSVDDKTALFTAELFPNPAAGKTTVLLDVKFADEFYLTLRDITGKQVVRHIALGNLHGQKEIALDLSGLAGGLYLLEIRSGEGAIHRKLIIEN